MAIEFDPRASIQALADGTIRTGGQTLGDFYRVNVQGNGSCFVEIDDGDLATPRFSGQKFIRFFGDSSSSGNGRCEASSVDEGSTSGQRDTSTTQANGTVQHIAFSFRIRGAGAIPTASWGYLVMQGKSLVSNGSPTLGYPSGLSPQISFINEGTSMGSSIRIRTLGGSGVAGKQSANYPIVGDQWYDVIMVVRAEVTTSGYCRVWIVPAGTPLPVEASPTLRCDNTPTNYTRNGGIEPIIYRFGGYYGPGVPDKDILMTPPIRCDTFSEALAYFNQTGGGGGGGGGGGEPTPAPADTIGQHLAGPLPRPVANDRRRGTDFASTTSATRQLDFGYAWIDTLGTPSEDPALLKMVVYNASSGALLATSDEVEISAGSPMLERTFTFSGTQTIPAGVTLRIQIHAGGPLNLARVAAFLVTDALVFIDDTYSDGPAATHGTGTLDDYQISARVHHVQTSAGPPGGGAVVGGTVQVRVDVGGSIAGSVIPAVGTIPRAEVATLNFFVPVYIPDAQLWQVNRDTQAPIQRVQPSADPNFYTPYED